MILAKVDFNYKTNRYEARDAETQQVVAKGQTFEATRKAAEDQGYWVSQRL